MIVPLATKILYKLQFQVLGPGKLKIIVVEFSQVGLNKTADYHWLFFRPPIVVRKVFKEMKAFF